MAPSSSDAPVAPAASLQHREAVARFDLLRVTSYDVELDLAGSPETFRSVTTIVLVSNGGSTFLDVKPVQLHAISVDDVPLDPGALGRGRYPLDLPAGEHRIRVEATMRFRNDGEGLHRSTDPADGRDYVYGMSFMDAAPSIFACFDQPDLKAPYTFRVTAPEDWTVVGNAPATNPEPGRWELGPTQPLSTYFVTLVAGPYHVLRSEHDGIALGLSARQSLAEALEADAEELFEITAQCFDEFHRLFGIRYPFGDYHQAFVPEFNAGAMENPGCVTFRDPLVFTDRVTRGARILRATTVAHEMAHQWFGNIVTPKWWDDLWLNESFAEYMGNRVTADVTEYDDAWTDMAFARRQWGLTADLRPSTHPVAGNGAVDAAAALQDFDGISYAKGSAILRQLNTAMGDEVFFAGVTDHLTRHRFGNATLDDLFASWERAGSGDLGDVTTHWLRTAGPDRVGLDRTAASVRRVPPADHPADRTHHTAAAVLRDGAWELRPLTLAGEATPLDVGDLPVVLDPHLETWAAVELDPATLRALPGVMPTVTDPLVRAAIWNNVRTAFRFATLDPADVLDLATAALPVEDTEDTARRTMSWIFSTLLPVTAPDAIRRLHAAALDALAAAEPGSDVQLSALRAAVRSATDPEELRTWLEVLPAGVEADLDLRWRLLVRLAALGATDRAELQAELDREPTSAAVVRHTSAVASLPDAEAKAYAWDRFTGKVDVPNYELEAAGHGMWRGGQEHLLAEYVDRYFVDLPATVSVRSGWTLADAAAQFFPVTSLDPATLERARALAADPALDLSLRRRLSDAADDLACRLAVLEAFPRP
ncbi:aminopeptidase N [Nocardioides sp. SYSU D00038]|uniref:aminopeptidase N n=1 Tax=Nocardioides sp. SYSU D00038 TaxID=2812554 RepID=UPI00196719ED|nr:aminopeptidase N [Nocardioides sp. SYSU D00038]